MARASESSERERRSANTKDVMEALAICNLFYAEVHDHAYRTREVVVGRSMDAEQMTRQVVSATRDSSIY